MVVWLKRVFVANHEDEDIAAERSAGAGARAGEVGCRVRFNPGTYVRFGIQSVRCASSVGRLVD